MTHALLNGLASYDDDDAGVPEATEKLRRRDYTKHVSG
jgi:hypothetical protein